MKQRKPLTREQYLKKFSRAVRWRLPPRDAEEAIADYRELIFQTERDETKLVEELGDPVQAAHLLTDVRTYRRWLKVFAVLAFGLFLLVNWLWLARTFSYRFLYWEDVWYPVLVMAVGLPLSLYWFRRHGQKNGPLSRQLVLALAVVLAYGVLFAALTWYIMSPEFLAYYAEIYPHTIPWYVLLQRDMMSIGGAACALIALVGLVLAKCCDRRWLALYTLGLTVAVMIAFATFVIRWMDLSMSSPYEVQPYLFARLLPLGAIGLIGTGVALC